MLHKPTALSWIWRFPLIMLFIVVSYTIALVLGLTERKMTREEQCEKYGLN